MPVTLQGSIIEPPEEAGNQLDCVICHGKTYNVGGVNNNRQVLFGDDGSVYWSHATLEDAQTVGDRVTANACKRCHVNTGGKVFSPEGKLVKAYKYGTDYVPESYSFTYDTGNGNEETAIIDWGCTCCCRDDLCRLSLYR